jgi:hypothetical protein
MEDQDPVQYVIDHAEDIAREIQLLRDSLKQMRCKGYAKLINGTDWDDESTYKGMWIISKNRDLIKKIDGISGYSSNPEHRYYHIIPIAERVGVRNNDVEFLPKTSEILEYRDQ